MKLKYVSTIALILLVSTSALCQDNQFALDDIIKEIKIALQKSQTELAKATLPKLKSVDLTFETAGTKKVSGKVKFLIFSFGTEIKKEDVQVVSFKLTPPEPNEKLAVSSKRAFSQRLTDALVSSARAIRAVRLTDSEPKLTLSEMSVELKFVISKGADAGVTFEILPVTAELGGGLGNSSVHKIKVTYAKN